MKINWKNVAVVLLVIGGSVGVSVAAIRSTKAKPSSVATMSDSFMASIQPDSSSCKVCSNGNDTHCAGGSCPQCETMMNMTMNQTMNMDGTAQAAMSGEKMSNVSNANAMSQSMTDKSMMPGIDSAKMADEEQMAVSPKM